MTRGALLACLLLVSGAPAALAVDEMASAAPGDGRLTLAPARFQPIDVVPGESYRLQLVARNGTDASLELTAYAIGLVGSPQADALAVPAATGSRAAAAAARWVTFPAFERPRTVRAGHELRFEARIEVPDDAAPGVTALGFAISQVIRSRGTIGDEQPGSRVRLAAGLASSVVLRIPGDVVASVRVTSVQSPRVVWGGANGTWKLGVENDGDTDLTVTADLELDGRVGSAHRDLESGSGAAQHVLPDGHRSFTITWKDPPWLGWYTPTLVLTDTQDARGLQERHQLPSVVVLPPWSMLALLLIAVALPVFRLHRRRHRRRRRRAG